MRTCTIEGCHKRHTAKGLCVTHYARLSRTGNVGSAELLRRERGTGSYQTNGYLQIGVKGHPLADKKGYAYAHRLALYDKIGPGTHYCYHCSELVTWGIDLEVDHLDWCRTNNNPSNLVPSCHDCNTMRKAPK